MPRQVPGGDEALSGSSEQPVWDLPVRLVHWLLAALIGFSWWSIENHHTDWHIWSGFAILTLSRGRFFPATPQQQNLIVFVRARKSGEDLLGGISTRRLVSFRVDLNG